MWWRHPRGDRPSGQVAMATVAVVAAPALPRQKGRARVSQVQAHGIWSGGGLHPPAVQNVPFGSTIISHPRAASFCTQMPCCPLGSIPACAPTRRVSPRSPHQRQSAKPGQSSVQPSLPSSTYLTAFMPFLLRSITLWSLLFPSSSRSSRLRST